jgi:predicted nucleic acid-binding protein
MIVADTNTVVSAFLWGGPPAAVLTGARGRRCAADARGVPGLSTIVRPAPIEATARDPDDDHVLACALGADAVLIVTRDRDLLDLGTFRDIRILPAHAALALINSAIR